MSTLQSTYFTGMGRPLFGNAFRSGSPIILRHTHVFDKDVTSSDVLEMFVFPPYCRISRFTMISANVGAINVDIGLMTGTPGDAVTARTVTASLAAAVAANTTIETALLALTTLGKTGDSPLSIGLVPASTISAAANKTITFMATLF